MNFSPKELAQIVERKIDKIIFYTNDKPQFSINVKERVQKRIDSDPNLQMQLVKQALESED